MTSYYSSLIIDFLKTSNDELLGVLTKGASEDIHQSIRILQTISWKDEINILKKVLRSITNFESNSGILLEYFIPRRSKRIDAVILTHNIIFVLEFKNSNLEAKTGYNRSDIEQCEDYALDLRDFHKESNHKVIVPILIDTSANCIASFSEVDDPVKKVRAVNNFEEISKAITHSIAQYGSINTL